MTTRALEDSEIKSIFSNINGIHAKRNETLLITGIGLALRASELVALKVSDVYDKKVKSYVTIRPETAKFGKERTIRIGDGITISDFLNWKRQKKESCAKRAPLFLSQKGGHLTRQALFEIIKRIFQEAGIEQSPIERISGKIEALLSEPTPPKTDERIAAGVFAIFVFILILAIINK